MDTTTDSGTGGRPFRLGFFSYLLGDEPRARVYAETLQIFDAAAGRGFDTAWVAQQHFGHLGGLPSPLVFFAALAARAPRIGVGTAVVALPLEHPLRVAEDAAVFEALYPGRLQLGLGAGIGAPATQAAFGLDGADKRERYDRAIGRLLGALGGEPVGADGFAGAAEGDEGAQAGVLFDVLQGEAVDVLVGGPGGGGRGSGRGSARRVVARSPPWAGRRRPA